jgi:hypothetical protein
LAGPLRVMKIAIQAASLYEAFELAMGLFLALGLLQRGQLALGQHKAFLRHFQHHAVAGPETVPPGLGQWHRTEGGWLNNDRAAEEGETVADNCFG